MRSAKLLLALAVLCVFVAACTGAGRSDPPTSMPAQATDENPDDASGAAGAGGGGVLAIAVKEEPTGWNPAVDEWNGPALQYARALFDPLVAYDSNNQLQPELAESIEPNSDFMEWTIVIRENVQFSDGSPLDAAAVRSNLEAQRTSPLARAAMAPIKSVFVTGPRTVRVLMRSPWSTFPHLLASQVGFIAAPSVFDDPAGSTTPVGSGPFVMASWNPGKSLVADRNPRYRRSGLPRLDGIEFRVIQDDQERTDAFLDGQVDVLMTDDPYEILRLNSQAQTEQFNVSLDRDGEAPKLAVALNVERAPFIDLTARQAVTFATDRAELSEVATDHVYDPIMGPISPTSPWFEEVVFPDGDRKEAEVSARHLLQRYGTELNFELLVPPNPVSLAVAAQWQRQLISVGVTVQIVPEDLAEIERRTRRGEFQAALIEGFGRWHPDFMYPLVHQAEMTPVGVDGPNITRFGTNNIDRALDSARMTGDLALQVDDQRIVETEIVGGMAYVFMLRVAEAIAFDADVRDLTSWTMSNGMPGLDFDGNAVSLTHVWIDRNS